MKLPPIEKVYEAWSAVADGRVALDGDNKARVISSDRTKVYTVELDSATDTFRSNDNATFWRGYPGYPVLAVMMVRGLLPLDMAQAEQWKDVNWNALNAKYRRDYAAAVAEIERERGINSARAHARAQAVMDTLAALPFKTMRLNMKQV